MAITNSIVPTLIVVTRSHKSITFSFAGEAERRADLQLA